MNPGVKERLLLLHESLRQYTGRDNNLDGFRECFKAFDGLSGPAGQFNTSCPDEISTLNRLKRMLPQATVADILSHEDERKKLDFMFGELHGSSSTTKIPQLLEFLRVLAGSNFAQFGDGLWESASEQRGNQVATPESGFATTPADGPAFGGLFPGVSGPMTKLAPFPSSQALLKPPPPIVAPGQVAVTESQLIRDLMSVVQGFEGQYVKLTTDGCRMCAGVEIDIGMRQLALKIGYTGWLSHKLKKFCEDRQREPVTSLCSQKICNVIHEELQEYRINVATLDAKVHRDDPDSSWKEPMNRSDQLTLGKFYLAILDLQHRLNILLNLVTATTGLKGGQLLTVLHKHSHHGDPVVQLLASKLIYLAVEPILIQIRRWLFSGLCDDTFHEFFVAYDPSPSFELYWSDRFQLRDAMTPYFLSADFAKQLFVGGKSIAFIRNFCNDRKPVLGMEKYAHLADCTFDGHDVLWDKQRNFMKSDQVAGLSGACRIATESVVNMLREEHDLGAHFRVLKKFLFLGQGDFVLYLMDSLEDYLNEPAMELYIRNLTAILNEAIRSTTAQFEPPEVINCLDTFVNAVDNTEIGWDAFMLEYRVKGPLTIVFTTAVLTRYKRIFAFLWRVKRAEFLLCNIWKNDMCTRLDYRAIQGFYALSHEARLVLNRMMQFVQQLQYSFNTEILEVAWNKFVESIAQATSLDDILSCHHEYLLHVEEKCFIQSKTIKNIQDQGVHLRAVMNQVVKFTTFAENMSYAARSELKALELHEPNLRSVFYLKTLPELSTKLQMLQTFFKNEVSRFMMLLDSNDADPTSNLRIRLDYNNHYTETGKKVRNQEALNAAGFTDSPNSY